MPEAYLDSWAGEESYRAQTADRPAPLGPEEVTQPPVQDHPDGSVEVRPLSSHEQDG